MQPNFVWHMPTTGAFMQVALMKSVNTSCSSLALVMERILSLLSNVSCNMQEKPQRLLVARGTSFSRFLVGFSQIYCG